MSNNVGRNQPCPCGSGKKYKHCCWGKDTKSEAKNRNLFVWGGALIVGIIVVLVINSNDSESPGFQSQPSGQAPAGKVWSAEHGHWHDAPGTAPATTFPNSPTPADSVVSTLTTPQPGPAPPGKVWSAEHGHWHDDPGTTSALNAPGLQRPPEPVVSTQITPQPGPAPPGKVWSPEHGHWHDAPSPSPDAIPNWNKPRDSAKPASRQPDSTPY